MSSACQSPGAGDSPPAFPWRNDPRGDAKTRLFRQVAGAGELQMLPCVLEDALGTTAGDASYHADRRLAERLFRESEFFRFEEPSDSGVSSDFAYVLPTFEGRRRFSLDASKHTAKPADGGGTERPVAKDTARNILTRRRRVDGDDADAVRASLLGALGAKRDATEDRYLAFEDRLDETNHLFVPYRTRFNSSVRVAESRERFGAAWDAAAAEYGRGVVLTLTTDPARYDSLEAATETLMDDVNRFKSWVANRFGDGTRPPSLPVVEFTDSGLPHVHVPLFGVSYLPHAAVKHYWDARRDRGSVVWVDAIAARSRTESGGGETWVWTGERPGRAEGAGPKAYLGKTLGDAAAFARERPESVHAAAAALRSDGGESESERAGAAEARTWWKLALYWATGTPFFTCSPSLKPGESGESGGLPYVSRWRFVGVAQLREFPSDAVVSGTVVRRDRREPPPGSSRRSGGSVSEVSES